MTVKTGEPGSIFIRKKGEILKIHRTVIEEVWFGFAGSFKSNLTFSTKTQQMWIKWSTSFKTVISKTTQTGRLKGKGLAKGK